MKFTAADKRSVMLIAWDFFRADRQECFASALKRAWAYIKRGRAHAAKFMKRYRGSQLVFMAAPGLSPGRGRNKGDDRRANRNLAQVAA